MSKDQTPKGWDGFDPEAVRAGRPTLDVRSTGSLLVCTGCGREFSAYRIRHYSLAHDGARIKNQNKGRATAHVRACQRKWAKAEAAKG